ncbi:hypothetical protein Misp01_53130 [Microtetraspora sp. NBRC 13810]|uniref:FxSxx-COOH system tetratricopeptide repeat protein n=1 Tax=Microtetraspora sp. NBRC 13810 TaxID=3030990 RepID=UPI0025560CD4|nr:FxSxx-COOH system tetratricopeptide repeat protein [Microtetraspora sp. NBRC 13810]GLW10184.1 hypothetical protein Misp01_53130 [Microtetraspora sp. NBRC 13810]
MAGSERRQVPKVLDPKIPQRNKNFTGRDSLLENLHKGISDVTAVLPHALHGMGGVGKTQVAIEYVWRYQDAYDLIWWMPADRPELIHSALAALAPRLDLPPAKAQGVEDAAASVLEALRKGEPYSRWLLVFDNAEQPEEVNRLIPRGPGHVLITSRNQEWKEAVPTVSVDVFDRRESVEFLHKRVSRSISTTDAARLARELGDLPLALEQAGAMQATTGMSVEEYLTLLEEQMPEVLEEHRPREYPRSMTAVWRLSVAQLEQQLPEAVDLLRCCAFFGPEPVPVDVFRWGTREGGPKLGDVLTNTLVRSRALRLIGSLALAKIDPDTRTFQVHRLIQALVRGELTAEEQERFRHAVHLLLMCAAPEQPDNEATWPRYRELVAHLAPAEIESCPDPLVRTFCNKMVRYLYRAGDGRASRIFAERFIDRWTLDSGPADRSVILAQRHLGNALRYLGLFSAAYEVDGIALNKARQHLGPEEPHTLAIANGFGADLRARGKFADALRHDEDTLSRHVSVYGETSPPTLFAMNNLALDYGLVSRYQEARDLQERTFTEQSNATRGVDAVSFVCAWNGFSRAVRQCGRYADAVDLGKDAYDYSVGELGREHVWTLRTAIDYSIALRRNGQHDEALTIASDTFERCKRLFGDNQPDTLAAAMNLTNVFRTLGEIDEAHKLARDTVVRYPTVYGDDHPYNYGCVGNLALLQRVRGDAVEARRLNAESLAGLDAKLTRDHHYSLTVASNLASDLTALGDLEQARLLSEDTLARVRTLLGEEHPLALGCAANLVSILRRQDRVEEAECLAGPTFAAYDRLLGPDHPDTLIAKEIRHLDFDFDPPPI